MSSIRIAVQTNLETDEQIAAIVSDAATIRAEEGCLQFELFRSMEYPENIVQLELWESESSYDRHWRAVLADSKRGGLLARGSSHLSAPRHHGTPQAPRRTGENGVEIYPFCSFGRAKDGTWARTIEAGLIEFVRWPARSGVRIILQLNLAAEAEEAALREAVATRTEPGCIQFEYFRGVEYPENTLLMELWQDPDIYDVHHLGRLRDDIFTNRKRPARTPVERRYGQKSYEWYQHSYFTLIDQIWQPEKISERSLSVRW